MITVFGAGTKINKIVESLPAEEARHMHRVGILVEMLAQKLGGFCGGERSPREYEHFGAAAAYHDIGKAMVPESILTKPGALTDNEAAAVRRHPVFAQMLFDKIRDGAITGMPEHLFALAYDSAVYHHERWNGTGYPYGLSSEEIPLIARITSICDAYDAITAKRVYQKVQTHTHACDELEKNAGTQFDPKLVQVFLDNEREIYSQGDKMKPLFSAGEAIRIQT